MLVISNFSFTPKCFLLLYASGLLNLRNVIELGMISLTSLCIMTFVSTECQPASLNFPCVSVSSLLMTKVTNQLLCSHKTEIKLEIVTESDFILSASSLTESQFKKRFPSTREDNS